MKGEITELFRSSAYFGFCISVGGFLLGIWLKKKTGWAVMNPLLVAIAAVVSILLFLNIDYDSYASSARILNDLLVPSTVCLALPLYKQLQMLKDNKLAVGAGIFSGVTASSVSIFGLCLLFGLEHEHYVTLLPKSITTAIGMGVSQELGGIVTLTVASIVITGIMGNVIAEAVFRIARIRHPIARGLALGTASHAIGTAKALELGETEGAMSSLAVAVAGLMTVVLAPVAAGWM